MTKGLLAKTAVAIAVLSLLCSCASMGSEVSSFQDIKDPHTAFVVFRASNGSPQSAVKTSYIQLLDAYDYANNNIMTAKVDGQGNSTPIVYSIKPGIYRLYLTAYLKPSLLDSLMGTEKYLVYEHPYFLDFLITAKPGQIVYLGDFVFDKKISISYDLQTIKAEVAKVAPNVQGFEWVSLWRDPPDWAKDLGTK